MRAVRFLHRSYVDGRVWEEGEEGLVSEDVSGAHIMDLETGKPTGEFGPVTFHSPMFIDHSGDARTDSSKSTAFNPLLASREAQMTGAENDPNERVQSGSPGDRQPDPDRQPD